MKLIYAFTGLLLTLAACSNTFQGVGQDLQADGRAISGWASPNPTPANNANKPQQPTPGSDPNAASSRY